MNRADLVQNIIYSTNQHTFITQQNRKNDRKTENIQQRNNEALISLSSSMQHSRFVDVLT